MIHRIAILGDFNPVYTTHHALNDSTRQVQRLLQKEIQFDWISTDLFRSEVVFKNHHYHGLWIAPGSPYKDMDNVLKAITYTRKNNIPTFGNCGGFQHMVIEFARNVCGISSADHEETNPDARELLISRLSCSLVEQHEALTVTDKDSLLFKILNKEQLTGSYFCSYGLNQVYLEQLRRNGFRPTTISKDGEVRSFELNDHRYFIGTLFQPALTSTALMPNPLIAEFVKESIRS
jgi:CTP synthase (UTP-ammonia lyase)